MHELRLFSYFRMLSSLYEDIKQVYDTIQHNKRCWTVLPEILDHTNKGHGRCNLDCMYDMELERKVLQIVDNSPQSTTGMNVDEVNVTV